MSVSLFKACKIIHNLDIPYSDQIIWDEKKIWKMLNYVYQETCCNKKNYLWVLQSNRWGLTLTYGNNQGKELRN